MKPFPPPAAETAEASIAAIGLQKPKRTGIPALNYSLISSTNTKVHFSWLGKDSTAAEEASSPFFRWKTQFPHISQ